MTKREEIREGIAKAIYGDWAIGSAPWEKTTQAEKAPWLRTAEKVMGDEASQGVVIKVDRELPKCPYSKDELLIGAYREALEDIVEAGYVAVEPLTLIRLTKE